MAEFEKQNNMADEVAEPCFAVVSKDFIENLLDISVPENKGGKRIRNKDI